MNNFRLALRSLAKTPLVTGVAILSLALGIGANAAIFSIFQQVLLKSLPVASPGQLVNLKSPGPKMGSQSTTNAGDDDSMQGELAIRVDTDLGHFGEVTGVAEMECETEAATFR